MAITRIYLVRHGQVHNPRAILYGRLPGFPLSPLGRAEADRAAGALSGKPLSALFSSPLERALATAAAIACRHPALKVEPSDLLTEVRTPFEGRPAAEADARGGDVYSGSPACFEQPEAIVDRVRRFFRLARDRYCGAEVAAVTHGDVIVFAALWACRLPATAAAKVGFARLGVLPGYPATGSITTFTFADQGPDARPRVQAGVAV